MFFQLLLHDYEGCGYSYLGAGRFCAFQAMSTKNEHFEVIRGVILWLHRIHEDQG